MSDATDGRWLGVIPSPGLFAVHGILLSNGNVLLFSGSVETSELPTESFEWDPATDISTAERVPMPAGVDLFCAHHVNLDDGRLLVAGGAGEFVGMTYVGDWGITAICIYDPSKPPAERWEKIGDMREGRWYPTLVTLPDGSLVTFSGIIRGNTHAATAEIFKPPFRGPAYTTETASGGDKSFPSYPGMSLVKGGKVVHCGTTWQYRGGGTTAPIGTFSFRKTGPASAMWIDESTSPDVDKREEGTFVLLPPAQDGKILLLGGGHIVGTSQSGDAEVSSAEILHTQETPMRWERIADMNHPRVNVSSVLLPDGKVLVLGGHDSYKWSSGLTPSNQAELYDPILGDDPSAWTPVATMNAPRQYHSAAVLLANGRVLTAGGVATGGANQSSIEIYEPPYFFNGPRPTITAVHRDDGPDDKIAYGGQITIETPQADRVRKVALMRPGSMTHHTDTEQRYVALSFMRLSSDRLRVGIVNDPTTAPPGYYMLWIVDDENRPCEQAVFLQLSRRKCRIITDRSHVSKDELNATGATTFNDALYVILDGFVPDELGVTTATPADEELDAIAPTITFTSGSGEFVREYPEIVAVPQKLLLEDDTLPEGVRQNVTFKYRIRFDNAGPFSNPDGTAVELQNLDIRSEKNGYTCRGDLTLTNQPNPYMVDGETHWLSTDVRVFQISEGDSRFGESIGSTPASAVSFIQAVLTRFGSDNAFANTQFGSISEDQATSKLELSRSKDGRRVFNFAIAKVRYRGQSLTATDVRVFFRMFTTAATGLDYRAGSTYRRGTNPSGDPVPLLGLRGGDLVTIPFFAETRVNTSVDSMTEQTDGFNRRTINPNGGAEVTEYFGCWLDFNQTALRFPLNPGGDGPYPSGLKSIQELIRGRHQCLAVEIHFSPDPIPEGDTPASNDNLSQRNLVIVESDNPGGPASRIVEHSFEIKASRNVGIGVQAARVPEYMVENQHGDHAHMEIRQELFRTEHDQLMIQWGNLPRNARAKLYVPGIASADILFLTEMTIGSDRVERVDDHTLELRIGDVSYISIPSSPTRSIPALLTIELPSGVKKGQQFNVSVFQIDGVDRQILGAFELVIPVSSATLILPEEERTLSVFKHIAAAIPAGDLWKPIFERQIAGLSDKVRDLGGDPDAVTASPDGDGKVESASQELGTRCVLMGLALSLALGLGVLSLELVGWAFGGVFLAVLVIPFLYWVKACRVSTSSLLRFLILGLLVGLGLLEIVG